MRVSHSLSFPASSASHAEAHRSALLTHREQQHLLI